MRNPEQTHRRLAALRADWPFYALALASLIAPAIVLGQGGGWHTALLSCPATLATPAIAVEAMLGLARFSEWMEGGAGG